MKTVGIVADNYKLVKFKKELTAKGFINFEVFPFTTETSTVRVKVEEDKIIELKKVCMLVELHFKRSN